MPVYDTRPYEAQTRRQSTRAAIAEGALRGLSSVFETYAQQKAIELEKKQKQDQLQRAYKAYENPNATAAQRALAVAELEPNEAKGFLQLLGQETKAASRKSALSDLAQSNPELFPELAGMGQQQDIDTGAGRGAIQPRMEPIEEMQGGIPGAGFSPQQPMQKPSLLASALQAAGRSIAPPQAQAPITNQGAQPMQQPARAVAPQGNQSIVDQRMQQQPPQGGPAQVRGPEQLSYAQRAERARLLNESGLHEEARLEVQQIQNDVKKEAAEKKAAATREAGLRKEKFEIHKSFQKADEDIEHGAKSAQNRMRAFNTMRKGLASGKLKPTQFENLATTALKGTRWENYFKNKERAEFEAASLEAYEGMKDMFGVRLSDADLQLASGKVPDPTKSKDANESIIDFLEFKDKMKLAEQQVADEIKAENGGFRPIDYTSQIRKRMQELYGDQAQQIVERAAYEGQPLPEPNAADPLMESVYGPLGNGEVRLKKGSEVIDVPMAYLNGALRDGFQLLEKGAQ